MIILSLLSLYYFQIRHIQCISLPQRDAEDAHEGILDGLAAVDGDGVVVRRDDLDRHARFNLDTIADFPALGSNSEKCHKCSD